MLMSSWFGGEKKKGDVEEAPRLKLQITVHAAHDICNVQWMGVQVLLWDLA